MTTVCGLQILRSVKWDDRINAVKWEKKWRGRGHCLFLRCIPEIRTERLRKTKTFPHQDIHCISWGPHVVPSSHTHIYIYILKNSLPLHLICFSCYVHQLTRQLAPYETRTFITFFSTLVPILPQMNPVYTFEISSLRSILILFSHLRLGLPSCIIPSYFQIINFYASLSHAGYMLRPCHLPWCDFPNNIWWRVQLWRSSFCSFLQSLVTSSLLGPDILVSTLLSNIVKLFVL
jgi:hypothetical protein